MKQRTNYVIKQLTLSEIAAWQLPVRQQHSNVFAKIPALQRGAVWKPGQVELLWDSILRGLPIGSFVVCQKLEEQKISSDSDDEQFSHHLLDGQQRANAIALGFDDQQSNGKNKRASLWLDLVPPDDKSTRCFLFRVTTEAHPWGYAKGDQAGIISTKQRIEALQEYGWRDQMGNPLKEGRPKLSETWPKDAEAPIPVAFLMNMLTINKELDNPIFFWANVREVLIQSKMKSSWAEKVIKLLENGGETLWYREKIFSALLSALEMRVVVLDVAREVIASPTVQEKLDNHEKESENTSKENIANVECLFQRLNSAGTPLSGEELAYSMIKAYWPEIRKRIDEIPEKRMPPSRLVMLGARVALADTKSPPDVLPGVQSVSSLRSIVLNNDSEKRDRIKKFFFESTKLKSVLNLIELWLGDDETQTDDIGLPPVLHTAIARNSPDVYLLLMWLARCALSESNGDLDMAKKNTYELRKYILGLATALHWFGYDKGRAVAALYKNGMRNGLLRPETFHEILVSVYVLEGNKIGLFRLPTPDTLALLIDLPVNEDELQKWQWWNRATDKDNANEKLPEYDALQIIERERELLLYAQRTYLKRRFKDYDPAREDLWEQHNRPWDYDHILPSSKISGKHYIPAGVKAWVYCIANLRAWPMEDNRSDQADSPIKKIRPSYYNDSFIIDMELDGFEKGYTEEIRNFDFANVFISAGKNRLLRIYREWYDTLEIGVLTGNSISQANQIK